MPSLESLWAEYGAWLERYVSEALDGDDGDGPVRAACYLTMVEAGRQIVEGRFPRASSNLWPWFERMAAEACRRVDAGDDDEAAIPAGPMPGALPASLRAAVRRRRMREWLDRRFGKFVAATFLPGALARAKDALSRQARSAWRRAGVATPPGSPATNGVLGAAFGSGVSEAAAAAVAVVFLGLGGGATDAPPAALEATPDPPISPMAVAHRATFAGSESSRPPARDPAPDAASLTSEPPPGEEVGDDDGALDQPGGPPTPPAPIVDAKASERVREPVQAEAHEGGEEWSTNDEPATTDLDGDGEEDLTVQPPLVVMNCPEPEERGLVTAAACPAVEEGTSDG